MAAPSVWMSAHDNRPESPYEAFYRNPRAENGKLYLANRSHEYNTSQDAMIFADTFKDK